MPSPEKSRVNANNRHGFFRMKVRLKIHHLFAAALVAISLHAQNPLSVSKPEQDNSVKAELASFALDKRLQVNLFAGEMMGIANPVCMRWDARGR